MPSGDMYTAVAKGVAVTAQQDFFQITAGANTVIRVHAWALTQETKVGDANEAELRLTTNRATGSFTTGSGGTTATVTPIARTAASVSAGVKVNNTTKIAVGSGTLTTDLEVYNWNIRVPMVMIYTPEMRPMVIGADAWTLELETTPGASTTISATVWFEEIG